MTRARWLLLPMACALAFTFGTPAMALNPQPLPPGFKQPNSSPAGRFHTLCCDGRHLQRYAQGHRVR
jgi:hypothetical protein